VSRPRLALVLLAALLGSTSGCAVPPPAQAPATPPGGGAVARPATPAPTSTPQPGAPVASHIHGEPELDIGLAWDLDSTTVGFTGVQTLEVQSSTRPGMHSTAGPLAFRVSGNQLLVTPRDHRRAVPLLVLHAGDTLWVGPELLVRSDQALMQWRNGHWRGRFKVFLNSRGQLSLATRLPLERYLLGVVPGEIGALSDSLLEAGRAQAVAARSYTLFYKGRRGSEGFDLFATVEDQLFSPIEAEQPFATRCVQSTRGLVGLSGGEAIRANYCSTCGGMTAAAWEAWPTTAYDYLTSHTDAGAGGDFCANSPQYRWREQWSAREFVANIARFAPQFGVGLPPGGVGDLVDVRVAQRSRSGRVWWLEVETTTGLIRIHAHSLRQMLRRGGNPNAILRSNLFKIGVLRDPDSRQARSVVASGAGSGHGVGLCQTGALAMARRGVSGEGILGHYYPGVSLKRVY
jgi:stage II sporulation protein D